MQSQCLLPILMGLSGLPKGTNANLHFLLKIGGYKMKCKPWRVFPGLFSFAFTNSHSFLPHSAVFSSFTCKYPAFLKAGAMIVLSSFVISMAAVLKWHCSPWKSVRSGDSPTQGSESAGLGWELGDCPFTKLLGWFWHRWSLEPTSRETETV